MIYLDKVHYELQPCGSVVSSCGVSVCKVDATDEEEVKKYSLGKMNDVKYFPEQEELEDSLEEFGRRRGADFPAGSRHHSGRPEKASPGQEDSANHGRRGTAQPSLGEK